MAHDFFLSSNFYFLWYYFYNCLAFFGILKEIFAVENYVFYLASFRDFLKFVLYLRRHNIMNCIPKPAIINFKMYNSPNLLVKT